MAKGTAYRLRVHPRVPPRLKRLEELANNLWYAWDRPTRGLFSQLHPALWNAVGHNPKAFLQRVDERRLKEVAEDPVFLGSLNKVLSAYDTYHNEPLRSNGSEWLRRDDLVAYFCAEFGFHESLPIYSGGLGILAGDHCKSASDIRLPFVGVGLLYRQGYFSQVMDAEGNQHASMRDSEFEAMPIEPVLDASGNEVRVEVDLPGRRVCAKAWSARVGHVRIYLLDTDIEANSEHDRNIAHQLYGGDRTTRIEQEIMLGVGGVRLLAALNFSPTVWHINEGHAAFLVFERMRSLVKQGLNFDAALEAVTLYELLQDHVAPTYYERGEMGYSPAWVKMSKRSIASLLPRFNSTRMVTEYLRKTYLPAAQQGRRYRDSGFSAAHDVARWKSKVRHAWTGVRVRRMDTPPTSIAFGAELCVQVAVHLNGLSAGDVAVELMMGRPAVGPRMQHSVRYELEWEGVKTQAGEDQFALKLAPEQYGNLQYRIRVYPCHELLTHPFETGLMIWL